MSIVVGIVIGVIGTLIFQAVFDEALDWWAEMVATAREWVMTILGVCGVLFVVCVSAYAAGWRP